MSSKCDLTWRLAQQSSRPGLQVWEEVKFEPEVMCEPCEPGLTLALAQLEDGDILCFQRALTEVGELLWCSMMHERGTADCTSHNKAGPFHANG